MALPGQLGGALTRSGRLQAALPFCHEISLQSTVGIRPSLRQQLEQIQGFIWVRRKNGVVFCSSRASKIWISASNAATVDTKSVYSNRMGPVAQGSSIMSFTTTLAMAFSGIK